MKFFVLLPKEYFLNQKAERTKVLFFSGADFGYGIAIILVVFSKNIGNILRFRLNLRILWFLASLEFAGTEID